MGRELGTDSELQAGKAEGTPCGSKPGHLMRFQNHLPSDSATMDCSLGRRGFKGSPKTLMFSQSREAHPLRRYCKTLFLISFKCDKGTGKQNQSIVVSRESVIWKIRGSTPSQHSKRIKHQKSLLFLS